MRKSVRISVKGTPYYKAPDLMSTNSLSVGLLVALTHEPNNKYDKNAVAVSIKNSGAKIGHIPKEIAPKYANLLKTKNIIESKIYSFERDGSYIKIMIQVLYQEPEEEESTESSCQLWKTIAKLPTTSGVYTILNITSGRKYIGSSSNIKNRITSHLKDLKQGNHHNHALQSDFSSSDIDNFDAIVITLNPQDLAQEEENQIRMALNARIPLYNMTIDGQGNAFSKKNYTSSTTVSDRARRGSQGIPIHSPPPYPPVSKPTTGNHTHTEGRKNKIADFELKLKNLSNPGSFLYWWLTTSLFSMFLISTLSNKEKGSTILFSGSVIGLFLGSFLRNWAEDRKKSKADYISLKNEYEKFLREN